MMMRVVPSSYRFDYVREHRAQGITVIFANPSKKVVRQLEDARLVQHIGEPSFSSSCSHFLTFCTLICQVWSCQRHAHEASFLAWASECSSAAEFLAAMHHVQPIARFARADVGILVHRPGAHLCAVSGCSGVCSGAAAGGEQGRQDRRHRHLKGQPQSSSLTGHWTYQVRSIGAAPLMLSCF